MEDPPMSTEEDVLMINIQRPVFTQVGFDEHFGIIEKNTKPAGFFQHAKTYVQEKQCCTLLNLKHVIFNLFPILTWLPQYSLKKDFLYDVISGCTVAVMHIPQGMGYALLGGVAPIVGIYMAIFPVLVYVFFGTSHHISLGTFAVTCLMTGQVVDHYTHKESSNTSSLEQGNNTSSDPEALSNLEVATAVCLMVGIWQIVMGLLRLGSVAVILSDQLVSGFTTGAAFHVLTSQIKNLLGIKVPRYVGPFRLIRSYISIFTAIPLSNPAEVLISVISITCLAVYNDHLKPLYSKKVKIPLPVELIALVVGTLACYFGELNRLYNIRTIEEVPTGIPVPRAPPLWLLPSLIPDSIAVSVIAYVVSLSMARMSARKRGYQIRNNQELLAQGASNVVGSFFSCLPVAASLSRSLLQEAVGGKTQIAGVVSCGLLLIVLLWIGPFFESLPLAVLSSVIVVALKGMFMQYKDFTLVLRTFPLDAVVWMVTFVAVVIIDIDIGLGIGAVTSVVVLLCRGQRPRAALLGRVPNTEMFADTGVYSSVVEVPGFKVFRWTGAIHFANCENFRKAFHNVLVGNSKELSKDLTNLKQKRAKSKEAAADPLQPEELLNKEKSEALQHSVATEIHTIIFDCSALSFVDHSGVQMLSTLHKELVQQNKVLLLTSCGAPVMQQLDKCDFFSKFSKDLLYPSISDALAAVQSKLTDVKLDETCACLSAASEKDIDP